MLTEDSQDLSSRVAQLWTLLFDLCTIDPSLSTEGENSWFELRTSSFAPNISQWKRFFNDLAVIKRALLLLLLLFSFSVFWTLPGADSQFSDHFVEIATFSKIFELCFKMLLIYHFNMHDISFCLKTQNMDFLMEPTFSNFTFFKVK